MYTDWECKNSNLACKILNIQNDVYHVHLQHRLLICYSSWSFNKFPMKRGPENSSKGPAAKKQATFRRDSTSSTGILQVNNQIRSAKCITKETKAEKVQVPIRNPFFQRKANMEIPNSDYLSQLTQVGSVGGRLARFVGNWRKITSD